LQAHAAFVPLPHIQHTTSNTQHTQHTANTQHTHIEKSHKRSDKSVIVWELERGGDSFGYPKKALHGHSHFVQDVVISSDGQFCLSGSWDGTLRLWDLNTVSVCHGRAKASECVCMCVCSTGVVVLKNTVFVVVWWSALAWGCSRRALLLAGGCCRLPPLLLNCLVRLAGFSQVSVAAGVAVAAPGQPSTHSLLSCR